MPEPLVGILMGSASDRPVMKESAKILEQFGVPYEIRICSAHRMPGQTRTYARTAVERGLKVLIAGAGMAAHLAGTLASETILPVIGVPLAGSALNGVDALYATVQMPWGVPVATMTIGPAGAKNAAILAIQMLALNDPELQEKLRRYKIELAHR